MRTIGAACLSLALLLSACSGDGDAGRAGATASGSATSASPGPAESASPRPGEETAETATVPAPPRARNDRKGREAFGDYVLKAWIYALNTNDPRPLLDVSGPRPCDGCRELVRELRRRDREGWHVVLEGVRVSRTTVAGSGGRGRTVTVLAIPASESYHDDGTFRSTNPAHPRSRFEVEMLHTGSRFRLLSFSLY